MLFITLTTRADDYLLNIFQAVLPDERALEEVRLEAA